MNLRQHAGKIVAGSMIVAALGGGIASHSLIGSNAAETAFNLAQRNTAAQVPFLGPFAADKKHGTVCGPAVRLMEGALRRTTPPVRKSKAANCVGVATTNQLKVFQRRHHIPPSGIYGKRTHLALAHAYSKQQLLDLIYLDRQRADALHKQTILVATSHAYALRGLMGYCNHGALRDCSLRGVWPAWPDVPRHTDCSGYVQWVYFQAGLPNPNGSGVGNTHSLVLRGTAVKVNGPLKVGDLVFYSYNNSHVAIYIGHGLVSSHGRPGIDIHPYGYRPIFAIRRYS